MSPSQLVHSKALDIFREEVRAINTVAGLTPNFICYPIHANTIAAMSRRGGNALGIKNTGEPLISTWQILSRSFESSLTISQSVSSPHLGQKHKATPRSGI